MPELTGEESVRGWMQHPSVLENALSIGAMQITNLS